ncbi:MAG: citryl-CoA lyase [Methanobrevibacter sp.]|nr:citryl-CoA lyase [Methanobrevibacter sp.]
MQENNFRVNPKSLKTAVTHVEKDKIVTRGYNQRDLIEKIRFGDMVFLLLKGRLPSLKESKIFNHVLVSFCDHGVTPPSTQTARLITSSGSPMNSAIGGALLSFGNKHAGAIEKAMELYQSRISSVHLIDDSTIDNKQIASLAIDIYNDYIVKDKKIPGFGHRYHDVDPRAEKLMEIAVDKGYIGPHIKLALALQDLVYTKKHIKLNVDGANAAILSDLGFSPELGLGIFMIGRLPGLIAHSYEEKMDEEEFRRFCDLDDIEYMG